MKETLAFTCSLSDAAAQLDVSEATLRFWVEAFGDELGITRDWRGEPEFDDDHLETMGLIQGWVLNEGLSLSAVRERLRSDDVPSRDRVALHPELTFEVGPASVGAFQASPPEPVPLEPSPLEPSPPEPAVLETVARVIRQVEHLADEIQETRRRLDDMGEEIKFLADENRGLQELIGKLIQLVEGSQLRSEPTEGLPAEEKAPVVPEPTVDPRPPATGRPLVGELGANLRCTVRPWIPKELGPPAQRLLAKFAS